MVTSFIIIIIHIGYVSKAFRMFCLVCMLLVANPTILIVHGHFCHSLQHALTILLMIRVGGTHYK